MINPYGRTAKNIRKHSKMTTKSTAKRHNTAQLRGRGGVMSPYDRKEKCNRKHIKMITKSTAK